MREKKFGIASGVSLKTRIEHSGGIRRVYFRILKTEMGRHYIEVVNRRPERIRLVIESRCEPPGPLRYTNIANPPWRQAFTIDPAGWRGFEICEPVDEEIQNNGRSHAPGGSQKVIIDVIEIWSDSWRLDSSEPCHISVRTLRN
ncbi:hypothetical protein GCM10010193_39670 [Kitasatospora atroaurantiaca]|uniref:hypothetical protein n=1 Tax=Kitasatospora atroaurantiaca TaxID=285545 RepID=UPI0011A1BF9B|nr:hypothetical protein [Kitasatospora atroaurantiaca]